MHVVIVYDSIFGNTAEVARSIAAALEFDHAVRLATAQEARDVELGDTDLLVVGSPTRGFRPTPMISEFVEGLNDVSGMSAAAFDTRLDLGSVQPAPLRWVVEAGGYASARIASSLDHHGLILKGEPAGFIVTGTEGPLKEGELQRAQAWACSLVA